MKTLLLALTFTSALSAQLVLPNAVAAPQPEQQFMDVNGKPLAGSFLCTFAAGTSTPQATYTDSTAGTFNTNPIVLDSSGRASIWVGALLYKFVLYTGGNGSCPGSGVVQWSQDNVGDTTLFFTNYVKSVGTCSLITYTPSQTGGVTRTCSSKLNDTVSLTDLGALCNNSHDDTPAFQAAAALASITITLPVTGTCLLNANVTFPSTVALVIPQGALASVGSSFTLTLNSPFSAGNYQAFAGGGNVVLAGNGTAYPTWFPGADCGAQINAAYTALPSTGGIIEQLNSCSFITPIVFATNFKAALLRGVPGAGTTLTFTPSSGTALTLNYGTGLTMGKGVRDLTFTGPGHTSSTIGILIGGANGAQGTTIRDFKIQSFGVNMQFDSFTWIVQIEQGMIRDGGTNVLYPPPSTLTASGENIQWNHVTFADAPSPYTKSVWLQNSESSFTDCSFDQAQLYIGNGTNGAAQINIKGSHFENPNSGSPIYDLIVMDAENGNLLRLTDCFWEQDYNEGTIPEFMTVKGGNVYVTNFGMYTTSGPVTQFIKATGIANVTMWGFDDLSGNTAATVGGTSTGWMQLFAGASIGAGPFNMHLGPGAASAAGGGQLDVTGVIKASYNASVANSGVIAAQAPTGQVPILVGSTTPIPNMVANVALYDAAGTQQTFNNHMVTTEADLVSGSYTIVLSGLAQFISYAQCAGSNLSNANPFRFTITTPNTIVVTGTGADHIGVICVGF